MVTALDIWLRYGYVPVWLRFGYVFVMIWLRFGYDMVTVQYGYVLVTACSMDLVLVTCWLHTMGRSYVLVTFWLRLRNHNQILVTEIMDMVTIWLRKRASRDNFGYGNFQLDATAGVR